MWRTTAEYLLLKPPEVYKILLRHIVWIMFGTRINIAIIEIEYPLKHGFLTGGAPEVVTDIHSLMDGRIL
jgi:hypothetical protein